MAGTVTTAAGPILSGIDVSHCQGTINWQAVAAAGTVFAYAKATEGLGSPDTYFAANWAAMQAIASKQFVPRNSLRKRLLGPGFNVKFVDQKYVQASEALWTDWIG
jgi:hypothetical protein